MSALDTQIDGQHYKNVKLQPIELAYRLGASPAFCKLAKYISRDKGDRKVNLQKAIHCIQLEQDLIEYTQYYTSANMFAAKCNTGEDFVTNLIAEFCEQFHYPDDYGSCSKCYKMQDALYNMMLQDYSTAIESVKEYAQLVGITL